MSNKLFETYVDFKIKSVHREEDEEKDFITIEGFANTTTVDRVGDIILEEAWTKGGLDNYLKNPVILAYHQHDEPVGRMTDYAINNKGFRIVADILKDTKVYKLIKNEILKTFSVGFRTKDADYDTDTDIFVIKDLELMEVSVVSVPANADSTFSVRKSFKTDEEYTSFKSEYTKDTTAVITENVSEIISDNIEEKIMPTEFTKAEIEAQVRADIEKEIKDKAVAAAALKDEVEAQVAISTEGTIETIGAKVEDLKSEIEKRLEDDSKSMQESLDGLQNVIKEYAEDLANLTKSKMSFREKGTIEEEFTTKEMDTAVLVAKILNTDLEGTKYFKGLVEKSNLEHHQQLTEDWEATFSSRIYDDIRERLIVEPLFTNIELPSVTLHLPLNPEAGYGTWVTNAQLNAATSSGTTRLHEVEDISITAHKLATKELLGYEEEDDSLIALVPLIRDAAVRRMAKSSDKALLVGDSGQAAGTGEGLYPFNGLATIGVDDTRTFTMGGTVGSETAVTVANLATLRRSMDVFGHDPQDLIFVVNHHVYFDLLEDDDFRTVDMVGKLATIITGTVGFVSGTAVVVSGEFGAAGTGVPAGVCVNMSNYLKGNYKGIKVERERSVENQTNLLVVTRRFGMIELFPANPTVATILYPAS